VHEVRKAVIDTNIIVYDLFEDSAFHDEAADMLDQLAKWIIPSIVVHELVWFLKGLNLKAEDAYEAVRQYVLHEKAVLRPVSTSDIERSLTAIVQEKLSLARYNDKLILSVAAEEGAPIASFDKKLRKQASAAGLPVLPAAYPA